MKKLTFIMIAMTAITFVACGNKTTGNNDNGDEDSVFMLDGPGSVYVPTKEEVGAIAAETVERIYEEVSMAYKSEDWQTASSNLDKRFCSKDWNNTVAAVIEKDNKNSKEVGFFEADYWVMGQDWSDDLHATDVKLQDINLEEEPWRATVTLNLHNFNVIPVKVSLVYEDDGWMIDDLDDWKQNMKEYLAE